MSNSSQARVIIRSHQAKLPRFKLNMVLSKEDAEKVMIYVMELKAKEDNHGE